MAITPTELGSIMYVIGWSPGGTKAAQVAWWDNAIAVAGGESDLNPDAIGVAVGGDFLSAKHAVGIWQILVGVTSGQDDKLKKPYQNTQAAYALYRTRRWEPWKSSVGAHRDSWRGHGQEVYTYLHTHTDAQIKQTALAGLPNTEGVQEYVTPVPVGPTKEGIKKTVDPMLSWLQQLPTWLQGQFVGVGVFILGAILIILGIWVAVGRPGGSLVKKLPGV